MKSFMDSLKNFILKFVVESLTLGVLATLGFIFVSMWRFGGNAVQIVGAILLGIDIAYFWLGFGTVKVWQVAAKFLFGHPLGDITAGLYWAPIGIVKVDKEVGRLFQDELPGEPEQIFHEEGKVPDGMFPPIIIKFGQPDPATDTDALKKSPYNVEMAAKVVPVVAWRIKSLTTFRTVVQTIKNARKILTDKVTAVCNDDFSKVTPAKALLTLEATSDKIEKKLVTECSHWGVEIDDAYVKPFGFSHAMNTAVMGVPIANQNALAVERKADGEEYRLRKEGIGKAEAERLFLQARGTGLKSIAKKLNITEGALILQIEMMEKAFTNANYSIVPGSEMFTLASSLSETLKKMGGTKS